MAKKLKKSKTGLNPKTKFVLGSAVKGVISNQAVVDGSKEGPWWVAAIFFTISVIVPLIPNFVKISKSNGGDFLSSANYGFDTTLSKYAYEMKKDEQQFVIEGGTLHYYDHGTLDDSKFETPDDAYIANGSQTKAYINPINDQYDLRIFLWSTELTSKQLSSYVNSIAKQQFRRGTHVLKNEETDPEDSTYYTPNVLLLTPKTMAVALYKSNKTTQAATTLGGLDWLKVNSKDGLIDRLCAKAVEDGRMFTITEDEFVNDYRYDVISAFRKICTEAYLNQKVRTLWGNTGIYAGIYAGIILFLGLMIFILTRGKNNPFRYLNVWHCQKIAWWAAFTPAILGMILAFVFSGNMIGQMAFILLLSLRIMWLSMKQLRPLPPQQ